MKAPDKLFLTNGDEDHKITWGSDEVTWCADRITDDDVEYIRADLVFDLINDASKKGVKG